MDAPAGWSDGVTVSVGIGREWKEEDDWSMWDHAIQKLMGQIFPFYERIIVKMKYDISEMTRCEKLYIWYIFVFIITGSVHIFYVRANFDTLTFHTVTATTGKITLMIAILFGIVYKITGRSVAKYVSKRDWDRVVNAIDLPTATLQQKIFLYSFVIGFTFACVGMASFVVRGN